jgi:hypothetical protein
MRALLLMLLGCILLVGCSAHPPKKPSPCHYPQNVPLEARRS